jgi:hypothetical protein
MVALRTNSIPATQQPRRASLMAYSESTAHTITFVVDQCSKLPIMLVDQESGHIIARGFTYLLGPSKFVLVSSPFEHLYYLVEGDKCTCSERIGCEHTQDGYLVTRIVGNQFVDVPWCELTPDEQRAAENVLFASCSYEVAWQEAV